MATIPSYNPNLYGSGVYNYSGYFGGNPSVPNPTSTQSSAIAGNQANLGGLTDLASATNTFNSGQAAGQYNLNLPNYGAMTTQASGNILSNLKGNLPQDVVNQITQRAAERGISTGSPGSPNSNASLLRSLGLTSLDLMNLGENQLTQAVQRTPTSQLFTPQSFFTTPDEMQQAQYVSNLLAAAPIPSQAAVANMNAVRGGLGTGGSLFPSVGSGPDMSWFYSGTPGNYSNPTPTYYPGGTYTDPNTGANMMDLGGGVSWDTSWDPSTLFADTTPVDSGYYADYAPDEGY